MTVLLPTQPLPKRPDLQKKKEKEKKKLREFVEKLKKFVKKMVATVLAVLQLRANVYWLQKE